MEEPPQPDRERQARIAQGGILLFVAGILTITLSAFLRSFATTLVGLALAIGGGVLLFVAGLRDERG